MRRCILPLFIFLMLFTALLGQTYFDKQAGPDVYIQLQTGAGGQWCPECGMNLSMFYLTNHAYLNKPDDILQFCSIRCLAVHTAGAADIAAKTRVVDVSTGTFIAAHDAYYVIGSDIPGTMSKISKLAFHDRHEAKQFSQRHHAQEIVDFAGALQLALTQLESDNSMLSMKKQKLMFPKARALSKKLNIIPEDIPKFNGFIELKLFLRTQFPADTLDESQLQMLAVYLWNQVSSCAEDESLSQNISVPHDAKCPVCGMFVY